LYNSLVFNLNIDKAIAAQVSKKAQILTLF